MKKIKKIVLTLCMLVFTVTVLSTTVFASSKATLNASRAAVKESSTPYVYTKTERRNTAPSSHFKYYMNDKKDTLSVRMFQMSNGQTAYCVEYQVPVAKTPYNATNLFQSNWWKKLGRDKQYKLTRITLYGYPNVTYSDVPACDNYVATQCLIWETIEGKDLTYLLQSASSKKAYQRIKTAVNNHTTKPSFDNKTLVLSYDEETKTYKGSITDSNNKLDEFSFSKIDGVTITRNGNTLNFETDKEIKTPVTMRGNKTTVPSVRLQAPLCYENPKHQTVVSGTRADPVGTTLNIKTDSGDTKIEKQSEDEKDKSQKFRITNKENGIDITVMTDENGKYNCSLPSGVYTAQELDTPIRYLKPEKQTFTVKQGQVTTILFNNDLKRGGLELHKIDPISKKPLANATFKIFEKHTDKFMFEVVTDKDGYARLDEKALPYGDYYFIETKAPDKYLLDETKHFFEIKQDGFIYKEEVENAPSVGTIRSLLYQEPMQDAKTNPTTSATKDNTLSFFPITLLVGSFCLFTAYGIKQQKNKQYY